ncbi:hypothetical protein AJ88_46875 [Mesorhizobium amorphae CCBAU 01583]|nr:hypothetical protein AJ88_46875 [Mesorhizobium amorphae CCBAU 01583]
MRSSQKEISMDDNLPDDVLSSIFSQLAIQADSATPFEGDPAAAFYEINALRSTNQRFRALIENDETIRSKINKLEKISLFDRATRAMKEAENPACTKTTNDIITYHGLTDPKFQDRVRSAAAARDIDAIPDMVAPAAIELHGVTLPDNQDSIKWRATRRDIIAGMAAPTAIERNEMTDRSMQDRAKMILGEHSRQEGGRGR